MAPCPLIPRAHPDSDTHHFVTYRPAFERNQFTSISRLVELQSGPANRTRSLRATHRRAKKGRTMGQHKSDPGDAGSFSEIHERKPDDKTRTDGHHGNAVVVPAATAPSPVHIAASKSTKDKETEMQGIRELLEDLGEDCYAVTFYFGCLVAFIVSSIGFVLLPWSWIVATICVLVGFVIASLTGLPYSSPRR